jgi:trehalose 2-sulfotransferase
MTTPNIPPAARHRDVTSYLLCTVPRSGSWLLADLLEQTDLAGRPEEYFRPDHRRQWSKEWGIPVDGLYGRYVRAALNNTTTDNGVFGAKTHWYQFEWFTSELRGLPGANPAATDETLIERWLPRPHYVHLYREDTVRQAISYYRATYSDRWFHLVDEDQEDGSGGRFIRPVPAPQTPDWGHVRYLEEAIITHEQLWDKFFTRSGIVPLEVRYEDLAVSHEKTLQRVLDFIGVPLPPGTELPAPRLKKQADEETERLTQEYLAHRDHVEPRPFNLKDRRATILPQPLHATEAGQVTEPSAP